MWTLSRCLVIKQTVLYLTLTAIILISLGSAFEVSSATDISPKPTPVTADKVVQIGQIISSPQKWNLRQVRLKGTVTALRHLPRSSGMIARDSQVTFTLRDKTGQIEIYYTGTQGSLEPLDAKKLVNGKLLDAIVTIVHLTSPGLEGGTVAGKLIGVKRAVQ